MPTWLMLALPFLGFANGQALNFTINGHTIHNLNRLTTDLVVAGEYRYPCYVSVLVYQYPDQQAVVQGVNVYALAREKSSTTRYIGYGVGTTNNRGEACVLCLCRKDAVVFVASTMERLFALDSADQSAGLPPGYTFAILPRSEEILFTARSWGTIYGRTGPVYNLGQELPCMLAGMNNYNFKFSYRAVPDELVTTIPRDTYLNSSSWDYWPPYINTYQVCYIKVRMLTHSTQATIRVDSLSLSSGYTYGYFISGPKANPDSATTEEKAACLEYRCAGYDMNNSPMDTRLLGTIDVPNGPDTGCWTRTASDLVNVTTTGSGFTLNVQTSNNYGAQAGIFKSNTIEHARSMCYTGRDELVPDYEMDPNTGNAIEFDCISQ